MPSCCIKQCSARKSKNHPTLTLHKFPGNETLKKKWLEIIGIKNINHRHKLWYVCSLHFNETSINNTLDQSRLREGALPVPSLLPSKICLQATPAFQPTSSKIATDEPKKEILEVAQSAPILSISTEMLELQNNTARNTALMMTPENKIIQHLTKKCEVLAKKVRSLKEKIRRRDNKIDEFFEIITDLENKLINKENTTILKECAKPKIS